MTGLLIRRFASPSKEEVEHIGVIRNALISDGRDHLDYCSVSATLKALGLKFDKKMLIKVKLHLTLEFV